MLNSQRKLNIFKTTSANEREVYTYINLFGMCFSGDGYIAPSGPVGYGIGNFFGSSDDLENVALRCSEVGSESLSLLLLSLLTSLTNF